MIFFFQVSLTICSVILPPESRSMTAQIYCQQHRWLSGSEVAHITKECKAYSCAIKIGVSYYITNATALEFLTTAVNKSNDSINGFKGKANAF